jgi:hypothetical protein
MSKLQPSTKSDQLHSGSVEAVVPRLFHVVIDAIILLGFLYFGLLAINPSVVARAHERLPENFGRANIDPRLSRTGALVVLVVLLFLAVGWFSSVGI